jgi:hypothetical protein
MITKRSTSLFSKCLLSVGLGSPILESGELTGVSPWVGDLDVSRR